MPDSPGIFPFGKMTARDIGDRVRLTRTAQGLRQEDLALASGVGVRFIHDLEVGKPSVELGKALAVVEALGLEIRLDESTRP